MKLRLRKNSVRLRVNRREVDLLASGEELREAVEFPGNSRVTYVLQSSSESAPAASFEGGTISVSAPEDLVRSWAAGEAIGMYFDFASDQSRLTVAVEKDLECMDRSEGERDPDAFPRRPSHTC